MFRPLFLIIFLIIGVLFTLGYTQFPLMHIKTLLTDATIYTDRIETVEVNGEHRFANTVNDTYKQYFQYLYISSIITTCLIGGGIIVSYLRMKFISKILFILAKLFMILFSSSILMLYYSSYIENNIVTELPDGIQIPNEYKNITKTYGTGAILIMLATSIMIVNYILYCFIG